MAHCLLYLMTLWYYQREKNWTTQRGFCVEFKNSQITILMSLLYHNDTIIKKKKRVHPRGVCQSDKATPLHGKDTDER